MAEEHQVNTYDIMNSGVGTGMKVVEVSPVELHGYDQPAEVGGWERAELQGDPNERFMKTGTVEGRG